MHVVRERRRSRTLEGRPGELVTLLPVGGPAHGVRTEGLRFPLFGETLDPGTTRGVSNEIEGPVAKVSLAEGALLVDPTGGSAVKA